MEVQWLSQVVWCLDKLACVVLLTLCHGEFDYIEYTRLTCRSWDVKNSIIITFFNK